MPKYPSSCRSYFMSPKWTSHHSRKKTTNSRKLAPAAFPSLPLDQSPRAEATSSEVCAAALVPRPPAADPCRDSTVLPLCDLCGLPPWPNLGLPASGRATRARPPCLPCHEPVCAREFEEASRRGENELDWDLSPYRRFDEPNIVSKIWWHAVETWYALPPVKFETVDSEVQAEIKRLLSEGTLQDSELLPRRTEGSNLRNVETLYSNIEKLTAQSKVLETKLRIMKFQTAKLRESAKPSGYHPGPETVNLMCKRQQELRTLNSRLALKVNQEIDSAKVKHSFFSPPHNRRKLPLRGAFRPHAHSPVTLPIIGHGRDRDWRRFVRISCKEKGRAGCDQKALLVTGRTVVPYVTIPRWDGWPASEKQMDSESDPDVTDVDDGDPINKGDTRYTTAQGQYSQ